MKRFVLKVDDFRLNDGLSKFDRLIDLCDSRRVPMSIGVIGAGLRGGRFTSQSLVAQRCHAGTIELWNHSFSHKDMTALGDDVVAWEIATTTSLSARMLGHSPRGFGAPFNKCDDRVARIASEQGMEFTYETAFPSAHVLTPEYNVPLDGQPNLAEFIKRVERKGHPETLVVQIHPGRWLSRGFEQMGQCLDWLTAAGYQPTTVREALGVSSTTSQSGSASRAHDLMTEKLGAFWEQHASIYDAKLSNFSTYFLARFRANSLGIRRLLEEADADIGCHTVVDVGCGLAQWSLPFFDFEKDATVFAFDTNATIVQALSDAKEAQLIPYNFRPLAEDFTSSKRLPKGGVDRIVCANALNYIPTLAFATEAQRVLKDGALLILLNQTGAFNHAGVSSALESANLGMAKERAMSALRQELVRLGFAGLRPPRTTPTTRELEAILYAFGFQLIDDFIPNWEQTFHKRPTFEGLVFARRSWVGVGSLPESFRCDYRKLLYQAGCPELDAELFPQRAAELETPELARFRARAALGNVHDVDSTFQIDFQLGRLLRGGEFLKASKLAGALGADSVASVFAGAVASLMDADTLAAKKHIDRLESAALPEGVLGLLNAMCMMLDGNADGARAALAG